LGLVLLRSKLLNYTAGCSQTTTHLNSILGNTFLVYTVPPGSSYMCALQINRYFVGCVDDKFTDELRPLAGMTGPGRAAVVTVRILRHCRSVSHSLGRRRRPTNCPFKCTSFRDSPPPHAVRLPHTRALSAGWSGAAGSIRHARSLPQPPEVLIEDTNCSRSRVEDVEIAGSGSPAGGRRWASVIRY